MAIVGFNLSKIAAERKKGSKGKISISNNVSIKDIQDKAFPVQQGTQMSIRFLFEFISEYKPGMGSIVLHGDLMVIEDEKKGKEIVDKWKKEKKAPKELMTNILNTILNRCTVQSLLISRELSLPPPIPLPKVQEGESAK